MSAGHGDLSRDLGCRLIAGNDGGIADCDVEEFLRLYDQAAAELSTHQLYKLKERSLEIARTSVPGPSTEGWGINSNSIMEATVSAHGGRVHRVTIEEMRFVPEELEILPGDTVVWTVSPSCPIKHFIEIVDILCDTVEVEPPPLPPGKSFTWTFNKAGEYCAVSCVYSFMRGEVYAHSLDEVGTGLSEEGGPSSSVWVPPSSDSLTGASGKLGSARHLEDSRGEALRVGAQKPPDATMKTKHPNGVILPPPSGMNALPASSLLLSSPLPRAQGPRVPAVELTDSPAACGGERAVSSRCCLDDGEGGYDAEGEEGDEGGATVSSAVIGSQALVKAGGEEHAEDGACVVAGQADGQNAELMEYSDRDSDNCSMQNMPAGGNEETSESIAELPITSNNAEGVRLLIADDKVESPQTPQSLEETRTPYPHPPLQRIASAGKLHMKQLGPSESRLMLPVDPGSVLDLHDPIHSPPKRGALGNHIFRCKRCRAHFLSHFNAHRCSAMHTTRRTTVSTSGTSHQASLPYLPDRAELLTFWAALQPVKAAAILDLRTPGETGELLLREVTAMGADALNTAAGGNERRFHGSYWAATRELYAIASGAAPPPTDAAVLFDLLEAASEGTFLGASVKGSLADMVQLNNLGAALALLMEGRAAAAWLKSKEEINEAQKPQARSGKSRAKDKRRRERQRAQKKRRARGGSSATEDTCGNTTTTLDEATTTDVDATVASSRVDSDAEVSPLEVNSSEQQPTPTLPLHTVFEGKSEAVQNCEGRAQLISSSSAQCQCICEPQQLEPPTAAKLPYPTTHAQPISSAMVAQLAEPHIHRGAPSSTGLQLQFGSINMSEVLGSTEEGQPSVLCPRPPCSSNGSSSSVPSAHPALRQPRGLTGSVSTNGGSDSVGGEERSRTSLFPPNTYPLPPAHGMCVHHPTSSFQPPPDIHALPGPLQPASGTVALGIPVSAISMSYLHPGAAYASPLLHIPPAHHMYPPRMPIPMPAGAVVQPHPVPPGPPHPVLHHPSPRPPHPTAQPPPSGPSQVATSQTEPTRGEDVGLQSSPSNDEQRSAQEDADGDDAVVGELGTTAAETDTVARGVGGAGGVDVGNGGNSSRQKPSLQDANQFFAGLLRTMQDNEAEVDAGVEAEERGSGAAAVTDATMERRCFDVESALSVFQQRWRSAQLDISRGCGCKYLATGSGSSR